MLIRKCYFWKNNVRIGAGLSVKLYQNVIILDTVFQDNYASVSGGGTHIQECHKVSSKNTRFLNNHAESGGSSAFYKYCKVVVLKEFTVSNCKQKSYSNLAVEQSKLVICDDMVVNNNVAETGEANLLSFKFTNKTVFTSCQFLHNKRLIKGKGINLINIYIESTQISKNLLMVYTTSPYIYTSI